MKFRNEIPYGFWQAVCILHRSWGDHTHRTLNVFPREEPCIDVEHYSGPYDSLSSITQFRVTTDAFIDLKRCRAIIGSPYWGGRSTFKWEVTDELDRLYWETIAPRFEARTWGRE